MTAIVPVLVQVLKKTSDRVKPELWAQTLLHMFGMVQIAYIISIVYNGQRINNDLENSTQKTKH
jgi:hypothetical protein